MQQLLIWFFSFAPLILNADLDHLIFSELVITPSDAEYVKLTNPTTNSIDLSNYYMTDGTNVSEQLFYYKIAQGADFWSNSSTDFICRFPFGLNIGAGESIIISLRDSIRYKNEYGQNADLTLTEDMLDAIDGLNTKGNSSAPKLDNSSETLILFYWDGSTSSILDVDYLLWGSNSYAIDKTGVGNYLPETSVTNQSHMENHNADEKLVRIAGEGSESTSGGNGITGHDETSEPLSDTWIVTSLISSKPQIVSLSVSPASPTTNDILSFTAEVVDPDGLSSVTLNVILNSDTSFHIMNNSSGDLYSIDLGPYDTGGLLVYSVTASDITGLSETSNISSVLINENTGDISIAELLNDLDDYVGQVIEIDGVVTVPAGRLRTNFTEGFLQDESGRGIILYSSSLDTSFQRGDSVIVTAEVDEFDGKPELIYTNINILKQNVNIPTLELSIGEFNTLNFNYTFIKLWGKIISRSEPFGTNTGANVSLQDPSGDVTTVRIWNSTKILYNEDFELINSSLDSILQIGELVEISGIGGEYNGVGQIQPAYASDIVRKLEGQEGKFGVTLEVAPYPFVPQIGEVIAYSYSFPENTRIKLRVFDLAGRLITTLYDEYRGISFYKEATWDGRDNLNRIVPAGTYLIHLDVVDSKTGNSYEDVAPVVIGVFGD